LLQRDPLARARDRPGALRAEDRRRRGAVPVALALVDVAEVHADGLDVDEQLPLARRRIGDVLGLEDLGPAVAFEDHRAHGRAG
jgi:hypothetical protein